MAKILDGRTLSRQLNKALKARVADLARPPGLAVVMVGENAASQVYVRRKGIVAERIGFRHRQIDLPASTTQEALLAEIDALNDDDEIDGILVQLPLPGGLDTEAGRQRLEMHEREQFKILWDGWPAWLEAQEAGGSAPG